MAHCRVLIVDDVEPMLQLLAQALTGAPDIQVSGLARSGPEARLEATRRRPDVVLLDEVLPGESSLDLLAFFLELEIKVVLITGMEAPTHEIPQGACSRIEKPTWKTLDSDRARIRAAILAARDGKL